MMAMGVRERERGEGVEREYGQKIHLWMCSVVLNEASEARHIIERVADIGC